MQSCCVTIRTGFNVNIFSDTIRGFNNEGRTLVLCQLMQKVPGGGMLTPCARGAAGARGWLPVQSWALPGSWHCLSGINSQLQLSLAPAPSTALLSSVVTGGLIGSDDLAVIPGKIPTQAYTV